MGIAMELNKEQIQKIDQYLLSCGIQFVDVRMEIVDHFANSLEARLTKNPDLDFVKEIERIHKEFGDNGFKDLIDEKTKAVRKIFYKQSINHLFTFFKLPKILLTIGLFFGLYQMISLFEDRNNFFYMLLGIAIFLGFRLLFMVNLRDAGKNKFLMLNMTLPFFNVFYGFVMLLQFIDDRGEESLHNPLHNALHIGCFVLLYLFCWCGEYIYYKNKKDVTIKYPNFLKV